MITVVSAYKTQADTGQRVKLWQPGNRCPFCNNKLRKELRASKKHTPHPPCTVCTPLSFLALYLSLFSSG